MLYEKESKNIFPNTDITGGVAVLYRDSKTKCGEIGVFTPYPQLNTILKK